MTLAVALFFAAVPLQVDLASASIDTSTALGGMGGGDRGGDDDDDGRDSRGPVLAGDGVGAADSEASELGKSDATATEETEIVEETETTEQ